MNVLIVDDNEAAADLLRELLSMQTHTVHCAYTAQQAIDAFAARSFDVALVDLVLPDLPGAEVARHLRSKAGGKPLLLVAISGLAPDEAGNASAPGLFDHHLQKPIDFDVLDHILASPATR